MTVHVYKDGPRKGMMVTDSTTEEDAGQYERLRAKMNQRYAISKIIFEKGLLLGKDSLATAELDFLGNWTRADIPTKYKEMPGYDHDLD